MGRKERTFRVNLHPDSDDVEAAIRFIVEDVVAEVIENRRRRRHPHRSNDGGG
jgi:hypothetical protein